MENTKWATNIWLDQAITPRITLWIPRINWAQGTKNEPAFAMPTPNSASTAQCYDRWLMIYKVTFYQTLIDNQLNASQRLISPIMYQRMMTIVRLKWYEICHEHPNIIPAAYRYMCLVKHTNTVVRGHYVLGYFQHLTGAVSRKYVE